MSQTESNQAVLEAESEAAINEPVSRYVVVGVYQNHYGISTDSTVELMDSDVTQITRVPHSPKFISGVINHRGSIIPVINTRQLLGFRTNKAESEELIDMLAQFEHDHVNWLNELKQSIANDEEFSKSGAPKLCAFEKWHTDICGSEAQMQHLTKDDAQLGVMIQQFGPLHKNITALSARVSNLLASGEKADALKMVENSITTDLAKMHDLFARVKEGIVKVNVSMMIITELGSRKAALLVDSVHTVKDVPLSAVEPLPESAENHQFLKGLVHEDDGSYVLITDLGNIYDTACPADVAAES